MPKPKRRIVAGKSRAASVARHVGELRQRIEIFLRSKGAEISRKAVELYTAATKSDEDKVKRMLRELGFDEWDALAQEVRVSLIAIFEEGGAAAIKAISESPEPEFFDRLNEAALKYAQTRGAELVGKKVVDGELLDNPRAEWAISDSTRDGIQDLLEKAFRDGLTPQELSEELQDSYLFSGARADAIARTELAMAHIEGSLETWRASGVVSGKAWLLADTHELEDECDENEAVGVIGIDDDFPSGDGGPPAHVNCLCDLEAELIEEEEAA